MPAQASCKVLLKPHARVCGGRWEQGCVLLTGYVFLQHKWELVRASPSASGTGPTQSPRSSSRYRAPSLPFPWGQCDHTMGVQTS